MAREVVGESAGSGDNNVGDGTFYRIGFGLHGVAAIKDLGFVATGHGADNGTGLEGEFA